jgi:tripartite-type tricarboxylate transporter receptor subunit TctC
MIPGSTGTLREENMHRQRTLWAGLTLVFAALYLVIVAKAENYPSKPVTIVVTLAAGTGMDSITRLYADKLSQSLGKPVIVDNRPGAATMLGTASVAAAPPDGHTLLVATSSALAINQTLYKQIAYDPDKDLVPISLYLKSPFILIVNPALPINNVKDLIDYAKNSSTPLTYSSPGIGGLPYLAVEFMRWRFGFNLTHVPYRSSPQAIQDVAAGHVAMSFAEAGASLGLIRDGKLRAIAVSALTRLPVLPDVPTFADASGVSDFETVSWHVLLAPAKTPDDVVNRLHRDMQKIMADKDMQQKIAQLGLIPMDPPSVAETVAYIRAEREKWGKLVKQVGLEGSQ